MYHHKQIKSKKRPQSAELVDNLFTRFPKINKHKKSSSMRSDFERNRLVKLPLICQCLQKEIEPWPSQSGHSMNGSDK